MAKAEVQACKGGGQSGEKRKREKDENAEEEKQRRGMQRGGEKSFRPHRDLTFKRSF